MNEPNSEPYDASQEPKQAAEMLSAEQYPSAPPPAYFPSTNGQATQYQLPPGQYQMPPNGASAYYTTVQQPGYLQANGTTVYVEGVRPVYVVAALQNPPPDYMVLSIMNFLFCCWIFGLVAIVKSSQTRSAIMMGDRDRALADSRDARKWNLVSLIFGAIVWVIVVIIIIVAAAT